MENTKKYEVKASWGPVVTLGAFCWVFLWLAILSKVINGHWVYYSLFLYIVILGAFCFGTSRSFLRIDRCGITQRFGLRTQQAAWPDIQSVTLKRDSEKKQIEINLAVGDLFLSGPFKDREEKIWLILCKYCERYGHGKIRCIAQSH